MYPFTTAALLFVGLVVFIYSMYGRLLLLASTKGSDNRFDNITQRIADTFKYAIGQKRFLRANQKKADIKAGIMHCFIFWGFCVLSVRTITLFAIGFDESFVLPLSLPLQTAINATMNVFAVLVSVAVIYALYRRAIVKPVRVTKSLEGVIILCVIL